MVNHYFSAELIRTAKAGWLLMFMVRWFGRISCDYQHRELVTFSTFRGKRYCLYRTMING